MRRLATLLLLPSAIALPADVEMPKPPPGYTTLRFNEYYSYHSDPAKRTDPLDALKYLRLRADDSTWFLPFGGEVRERVELTSNPNFGLGGRNDGYLMQRLELRADLHLGERVRVQRVRPLRQTVCERLRSCEVAARKAH